MKNPLIDYYREKEIYVKLPTKGTWYKNKPNLTPDGELGILPMTLKDEMLFKIPDSLYNGESMYEVIRSIAPDIVDPFEVSIPDVDVILLASRAISSNEEMTVDARCPVCKKTASYSINIPSMLSKVIVNTEETEIEIRKLKIRLRPNTLAAVTASSIQSVENNRILHILSLKKNDENRDHAEFKKLMEKSLEVATAATIGLLADNVASIELPDGTIVDNIENIVEWIVNSDSATINILKKHAVKLNDNGLPKSFPFTCDNDECNHTFESGIEFNPTFFFIAK